MKHRLHVERCAALVEQLSAMEPLEPAVLEEQTVRLLLVVLRLLTQHQVNERGRCKACGWSRWGRRVWRPRPKCAVFQAVEYATGQGLDVVWWELFGVSGWEVGLEEVRGWVQERADDL